MLENMSRYSSKSICRVCLATNVKMYSLLHDDHKTVYEQVTGLSFSIDNSLPEVLCWECSYRLLKCYQFKTQALLTHSLLESLLEREGTITEQNVRKINRYKNGLQSKLTYCKTAPNYIEMQINEIGGIHDEKKQDGGATQSADDVDIKLELDNVIAKEDDFDHRVDIFENYDASDDSDKDKTDKAEPVANVPKPKVKTTINKSLFKITDLTFEEQVREIEKRKVTDNYTKSEFKCDKCFKGFLYESAFKFHMTRHTNKSGKYECEVCKVHFKAFSAMKHHATSHWQKFECKQCPYVTSRLHTAKLHEAFHNGTQYTCSHCEEVFSKQTTYMSHLRVKHPSDIVCELCGNSFISQKGLYLHKKLKHRFDEAITPQEKHRCEQCDLNFVKKEALQTHLRAKHNIGVREDGVIARRSKGSDPDTVRRNKILSRRYVRRCKPKEPVQCEQCDATLSDPRAYYCHFRRMHPDKNRTSYPSLKRNHPCMCEVCGRIFKCRSLLEDHSNTHAAGVQFKCPHCEKVFLTRYRLAVHSRAHSAQKTVFSCSVCEKNFSTRSNLQRHEFGHTGLKPHTCEMCGKSFKYADEQRAHFQYVHLKKPYPKRARARRVVKQDVNKTSPSDCSERWAGAPHD